jgi:hypothetical protein
MPSSSASLSRRCGDIGRERRWPCWDSRLHRRTLCAAALVEGSAAAFHGGSRGCCRLRHVDEPVAEIVPNSQPQDLRCVFNHFQRRVISL